MHPQLFLLPLQNIFATFDLSCLWLFRQYCQERNLLLFYAEWLLPSWWPFSGLNLLCHVTSHVISTLQLCPCKLSHLPSSYIPLPNISSTYQYLWFYLFFNHIEAQPRSSQFIQFRNWYLRTTILSLVQMSINFLMTSYRYWQEY